MNDSASNSALWNEIELSESYLVCCMFEEAASLAYSALKQVVQQESTGCKDIQAPELMESAGMVLVQSWRELGRVPKMLDELKGLFGAVELIPVSVFLAGVCFQLAEGIHSGVREFLEAFLTNWKYMDERYYVLVDEEADGNYMIGRNGHIMLSLEKYLEVVEVYIKFLVKVINDIDLTYACIEKMALPEETRQQIVRKLDSFCSDKATKSSKGGISTFLADEDGAHSSLKEPNASKGLPKSLNHQFGCGGTKGGFLHLFRRFGLFFSWFRTITMKFRNFRFVISNGKFLLGCIILVASYVVRWKHDTLKRLAWKQGVWFQKAIADVWQLAFSYQVNPLAAVQPNPALTSRSQVMPSSR